ncbi:hypothetical protein ACFV9X_31975 [Streptomyces anulatus]|uniref:hypothetical protein n=1 Tax=Streptomyces TaxID=1883 RepID=UPI003083A818
MHLMQLRDDVRFLPDRDVERTAVLAALTLRDVLIVFDYRRHKSDRTTVAALVQEQPRADPRRTGGPRVGRHDGPGRRGPKAHAAR